MQLFSYLCIIFMLIAEKSILDKTWCFSYYNIIQKLHYIRALPTNAENILK